ncbi:MAG: YegS/Rv2252/BmrU family lipid kinase [Actinomycetota bacterium]
MIAPGTADLAVVTNHTAGRGKAAGVAVRLRAVAEQRGHRVVELDASDATSTRTAIASLPPEVRRVIGIGGDGLTHHVVQHLAGADRELGLVPVGTGNDFATALDLPTDTDEAIEVALGPTRPIDAIETDHGWAASVATVGFSGDVNARADRIRLPLGSFVYTAATIVELPRLRPRGIWMGLDGADPIEIETVMLAVANTPRFGGGMLVCPDARPDDGLLDVTSVGPVGRTKLLRVFPRIFRGEHLSYPEVTTWRAATVTLSDGVDVWADGELLGPSPVTLRAVPGALRIAAPPDAGPR